jgi:sporulation protein YlmC with PRC-barrel domain
MEEDGLEAIGVLSGMLLNPDTGAVEGFFVRSPGFFGGSSSFLPSLDILRWGLRIIIRDQSSFCDPNDIIRLQPLLDGSRPMLGQSILTESGVRLGRCADVQFSTKSFRIEWLFPKKFFRWGTPIATSQIVEVTEDAIIVKNSVAPIEVKVAEEEEVPVMPQVEAA